jgi:SpoVK/Ycf46/Vps4 family AAA+-type ATPase
MNNLLKELGETYPLHEYRFHGERVSTVIDGETGFFSFMDPCKITYDSDGGQPELFPVASIDLYGEQFLLVIDKIQKRRRLINLFTPPEIYMNALLAQITFGPFSSEINQRFKSTLEAYYPTWEERELFCKKNLKQEDLTFQHYTDLFQIVKLDRFVFLFSLHGLFEYLVDGTEAEVEQFLEENMTKALLLKLKQDILPRMFEKK